MVRKIVAPKGKDTTDTPEDSRESDGNPHLYIRKRFIPIRPK